MFNLKVKRLYEVDVDESKPNKQKKPTLKTKPKKGKCHTTVTKIYNITF